VPASPGVRVAANPQEHRDCAVSASEASTDAVAGERMARRRGRPMTELPARLAEVAESAEELHALEEK
jgi:hypothetical protein